MLHLDNKSANKNDKEINYKDIISLKYPMRGISVVYGIPYYD